MTVTVPPARGADPADRTGRPWVREVRNQAADLLPINLYADDVALVEAVHRNGGGAAHDELVAAGAVAGSREAREHARRAERNEPRLVTHDRYGNRVDEVELDPSWHWLLDRAVELGVHAHPPADAPAGAHVDRAAGLFVWTQVDSGVMCPVSMTYAAVPALRDGAPELAGAWEPSLTRRDPATVALAGMAMTERQGGSDVRANTSRAEPLGGDRYALWGHKWFCSYPPCDVFLVLAQAPAGISCFLVERGPGMEFQRLKDKLGTRSLPSSEVELRGITGVLVGEEGRGVPTIIRMVNHTRLDCVLASAGSMRRGVAEAVNHARTRAAFGRPLVEQPLMRNVLADLVVESEAATAVALRVAAAYDRDDEAPFRRLATAVAKYWVCKRATGHAAEALECLGGNGYVEDSGLPLLLRDAPLPGIWEGSGNVIALDVLRATAREPEAVEAVVAELDAASGADSRLDAHVRATTDQLRATADSDDREATEFGARRLVEALGVALQGAELVRHGDTAVADAFCASRLQPGGHAYGTLPAGVEVAAVLERALPD